MNIARGLAIDLYLGVGHYAFEDDEYFFVLPGSRRAESIFIQTLLIGFLFVQSIGIVAKAHQLPLRRNGYGGPVAAIAAFGAKKLPGYGMVFICAGQIVNDRFLGKTTGAGYGDGQEQENLLHRS